MHVRAADEAVALNGSAPAETYGDGVKVLRADVDSGADAVHPGYGFLAEDAAFAQSVLDAGLTWIGPAPAVIRRLADKLSRPAGGRSGPMLRRTLPGRARHVETHCLAERYGDVVVVSTRDCSLQRRHQKVVEEVPVPFLSRGLDARLRVMSREILRAVGHVGAATCEFLLGRDGMLGFLETNARRRSRTRPARRSPAGPGSGDVPPGRGRADRLRRSAFPRACAVVQDLRRGSGPALHAVPGHHPWLASAARLWRAGGCRCRAGLGAAGTPGLERVRDQRGGDQFAVPPRADQERGVRTARCRRPMVRARGLG